jgi:protein gp37
MSDLFHEKIPFEFVFDVLTRMIVRADVTFQVLTKRPGRIQEFVEWIADNKLEQLNAAYASAYPCAEDIPVALFPLNVWLGTSIESRLYLPRKDVLKRVPVHTRFISFEPLLEDIGYFDLDGFSWVIVGGESGPGHRPFSKDWARNIRDRCRMADTAFFFKQSAGPRPGMDRLLDEREWNEFPDEVRA